jgi:lactoylglutathione lyase
MLIIGWADARPEGKEGEQMIRKLEHIGVLVKDMGVSIRFYTEVLGLAAVGKETLEDGVELVFLSFPGTDNIEIELISKGAEEITADGKVDHIAFTVTDIDAEVMRLKSLGVRLIDNEPRTLLGGRLRIAFFYGPDGEKLEFFQKNA